MARYCRQLNPKTRQEPGDRHNHCMTGVRRFIPPFPFFNWGHGMCAGCAHRKRIGQVLVSKAFGHAFCGHWYFCPFDETCCLQFGMGAPPLRLRTLCILYLFRSRPFFFFGCLFFLLWATIVKVVFSPIVSLALTDRRVEFASFDYRSIRFVYG